jgi:tRNA G18 (ribose-2'-O)-methylase SpoU
MGTDKTVPFKSVPELAAAITELRQQGYTILAAEPGGGPEAEAWRQNYTPPLAVIFGNEALGVHPEALKMVDGLVSLPMAGTKASINVSNAAAAIMYAIQARISEKAHEHED